MRKSPAVGAEGVRQKWPMNVITTFHVPRVPDRSFQTTHPPSVPSGSRETASSGDMFRRHLNGARCWVPDGTNATTRKVPGICALFGTPNGRCG